MAWPETIYPYDPSKALPIVFAVIIFLLSLALFLQNIRYKWYYFCITTSMASATWVSGFVVRAISANRPSSLGLYLAQYILVFAGPPIYAASEYHILGQLLAYLPYHAPLHPGRVMSTFLMLSAAIEALAASGAAGLGDAKAKPDARDSAIVRIKVSLILLELVEVAFFGLVALVEYRCRKAKNFPRNVRTMCRVLYVTSLMMTVRCIVRTMEGFEANGCDPKAPDFKGYCGPVQHYEWILWVFEVANITIFVAALVFFHPGRFLPSNPKQYLDPFDGTTDRIGPGWSAADKRPWLVTVLDPFALSSKTMGKGVAIDKFWERDNPVAEKGFATTKTNTKGIQDVELTSSG